MPDQPDAPNVCQSHENGAISLTLYGRAVTPLVCRGTALWYGALRDAPIRFVLVRDPTGRRDEAFFCTDLTGRVAFSLETYAKRWSLEVTFGDCTQGLGCEDPQNQTVAAVQRTAAFAGIVYALVVGAAQQLGAGATFTWPRRPWYCKKVSLAFTDLLAPLRQAGHAQPTALDPPAPAWSPRLFRGPHAQHGTSESPVAHDTFGCTLPANGETRG